MHQLTYRYSNVSFDCFVLNRDDANQNYTLGNVVDYYIPCAINPFVDELPRINFCKVWNENDESIKALPNEYCFK